MEPKNLIRSFLIGLATLVAVYSARAQLATTNKQDVTFGHVHLNVRDIETHKKLWVDLFGGNVAEKEGYTAVRVSGTLIFFNEKEPTAPSRETTIDHLGFKVRDLELILNKWKAMGYEVDEEPTGFPNNAYITMPGGVRLELTEYPEMPLKAEISYVQFYSPQYRELPAWYADLFLATPRDTDEDNSEIKAEMPGISLYFSKTEGERKPTDGTAIDHIGFEVEDMDAMIKKLQSKDVKFVFGPRYIESLKLWVVFFIAPSGVLVEVTEGLDNY